MLIIRAAVAGGTAPSAGLAIAACKVSKWTWNARNLLPHRDVAAQGDMKFQDHGRDPVGRAVQVVRRRWDVEPVLVGLITFPQPIQAADKGLQIARVVEW